MKILPLGKRGFILDESKLIKETKYEKQPDIIEIGKDGNEIRVEQSPKCIITYADGVIDITNEDYQGLLANTYRFSDDLKTVQPLTVVELHEQNEQKREFEAKQQLDQKINKLKQQLADMDYKSQKYLDGEYTSEQWTAIVAKRKALRGQIRILEI